MSRYTGLSLPAPPRRVQQENKAAWNDERERAQSDFFTIGYSGRDISDFTAALRSARVVTLVDVRFTPVSQYKPDFSKRNLQSRLAEDGITYLHRPLLGVPRDIRARAIDHSRDAIWEWYDAWVVPSFAGKNLHEFFNGAEHLLALMCTELDPTACHRHRLALALERHGLRGYDL